jgi:hypothetical protein
VGGNCDADQQTDTQVHGPQSGRNGSRTFRPLERPVDPGPRTWRSVR